MTGGFGCGVVVGVGEAVGVDVGNSASEGAWKDCTGMPVVATDMNRCQIRAGIEPPYTGGESTPFRSARTPGRRFVPPAVG